MQIAPDYRANQGFRNHEIAYQLPRRAYSRIHLLTIVSLQWEVKAPNFISIHVSSRYRIIIDKSVAASSIRPNDQAAPRHR
ncbi:uncharacterized protein H6S33_003839 [Morchella sextelata]|uniref:uncharacterized protein n=1 Tax=Morchella sextelata TaxID=1174677 RepID=UPI001D0516A7|nr:uncharacterized protein H6S33_003839 [Morchella sextelata]KAH0606178.1 hypothetical protein H6S33_003839 [Morchella sextelata]